MGAVRFLARWVSLAVFLACMTVFFFGHRSWEVAGFALVSLLVLVWACGGFSREAWFGTPEEEAHCARVDQALTAVERLARLHDAEWGVR